MKDRYEVCFYHLVDGQPVGFRKVSRNRFTTCLFMLEHYVDADRNGKTICGASLYDNGKLDRGLGICGHYISGEAGDV